MVACCPVDGNDGLLARTTRVDVEGDCSDSLSVIRETLGQGVSFGKHLSHDQQLGKADSAEIGTQARDLLESLRTSYAERSLDPYWGHRFWGCVREAESRGVDPVIMDLLRASGYSGPQALSAPMFEELEQELAALASPAETPLTLAAECCTGLDEELHRSEACSSSVESVRTELPWDANTPISMDEVKARVERGDDVATKAMLNIQRLAAEKQPAAKWVMLHRIALQQGRNQYVDPSTGFTVFTSAFLKQRRCCGFTCRHCPHLKKLAADW